MKTYEINKHLIYVVHSKWKIIIVAHIVSITAENNKGSALRAAVTHPGLKIHSEETVH